MLLLTAQPVPYNGMTVKRIEGGDRDDVPSRSPSPFPAAGAFGKNYVKAFLLLSAFSGLIYDIEGSWLLPKSTAKSARP
jgi:hypothetical protein